MSNTLYVVRVFISRKSFYFTFTSEEKASKIHSALKAENFSCDIGTEIERDVDYVLSTMRFHLAKEEASISYNASEA